MDHGSLKELEVVHQLVMNLICNGVGLYDCKLSLNGDVDFSVHPVPDPPRAYFRNILHSVHFVSGLSYLVHHIRLHAIQGPRKHGL